MKFKIGDMVFIAGTTKQGKRHACPDCGGVGTWKATTPLGREYEVGCPRCAMGYLSEHSLHLGYNVSAPRVDSIVIHTVKSDIRLVAEGLKEEVWYMESSTGSGSSYREDNCFATLEEATKVATDKANFENLKETERAAQMHPHQIKFHDYNIVDAQIEAAKKQQRDARYKHEDFINELRYALEDNDLPKLRKLLKEDE